MTTAPGLDAAAPDNAAAARIALEAGRPALVWRRLIADTETPVGAALKLMREGRGDFLLESVQGGEVRGRYSLLGIAPDLVFRARGAVAEINRGWATDQDAFAALPGNSLDALRKLVDECRIDVPAGLPPVLACLVGYFGYETIGLVEKLPRAPDSALDLPDMLFVRPTVLLVFDRLSDELVAVAPIWASSLAPARAIAAAGDRIDAALAGLNGPLPAEPRLTMPVEPVRTPVMPPERYAAMVERAQDYIYAGDIFQVVLAQRFTTPFPLPASALYRSLRRINPSPFLYFLDLPGFALIG